MPTAPPLRAHHSPQADASMDTDINGAATANGSAMPSPTVVPEVELYTYLLVTILLCDTNQFAKACRVHQHKFVLHTSVRLSRPRRSLRMPCSGSPHTTGERSMCWQLACISTTLGRMNAPTRWQTFAGALRCLPARLVAFLQQ